MTTAAKIGAFFLAALIVVGWFILRIEDMPFGKKARTSKVAVRFKDVAGLDDKSAVRVAGVRKGKVDGIELQKDGTALVHLVLDPDVEIRQGTTARIKALGLLGDKYVELVPGEIGSPELPKGTVVDGSAGKGMDDLTEMASKIGEDIKKVTEAMAGSLGGKQGEAKLNRIADNLGRLAESLAQLVDANRQNVDVTLVNLREFSAQLRESLARVDRILDENRANVKGTITNAEQVSEKLKGTADNLQEITDKLNAGRGTIGKLLNDDETVRNVNEALTSVRSGVEEFRSTLNRVNRLQIDLGFQGEYLARDGTSRQSFRLDVQPRENKFYRVEVVSLPRGHRLNSNETTTTTLPDGTQSTVRRDVETFEDKFGISLQLGYRLGNTVLRGGLIESRGGLAVDHYLLRDRLQLTGEFWDFHKFQKDDVKVKLLSRWNMTPNLYVSGGVDDAINPGTRSLLFGAGIRWKDEDLKALLGAAGSFIK